MNDFRQQCIDSLSAHTPQLSLQDLLHRSGHSDWPEYAPTEIVPGLYQGGTEDDDVLSIPSDDFRRRGRYPFDTVITLYASAQPVPWGVEELRFGFLDAGLDRADVTTVVRAARFAHQRWADGATVLIRCQAGMNRSGLITALVLMQAGLTAGQAITVIRDQRGKACLSNANFVRWLVSHASDALQTNTQNAA